MIKRITKQHEPKQVSKTEPIFTEIFTICD